MKNDFDLVENDKQLLKQEMCDTYIQVIEQQIRYLISRKLLPLNKNEKMLVKKSGVQSKVRKVNNFKMTNYEEERNGNNLSASEILYISACK